jgi:3-oxoacyl-[acyl-carrier protein] reductase
LNQLAGKRAIVTGAGRGIGAAIARRFAAEGAHVVIADVNVENARRVESEIVGDGGTATARDVDVASSASVAAMVSDTIREWGTVDVLVNNAGVLPIAPTPLDAILGVTETDWDKVIAINLKGAFLTSRAVLPHMLERERGVILNIASTAARSGGARGWVSYPASKAGIIGLTVDMSKKLAPRGIRVNAIAPGYIVTELTAEYSEAEHAQFARSCPMARGGTPAEIASAALFLCSDESSYVTGQVLNVDGGAVTF